ncbi:alpha/beta fold hydrolase [Streptomyces sp. NPDC047079]|uniref:thioesterase II family protein n=1 Tax=Streptomyces sp. NPDC047079 TaxID=3154607 RepID=UPI0034113A4B
MGGKWLRRFDESAVGAPRLVCFPHAGGAASSFVPLSRELAPDVDVLAVQYPGRQERLGEVPAEDITHLAEQVARALSPLALAPYALFGHSMGALIAYEAARCLERWSVAGPHRLFVSAQVPPGDRALEGRYADSDDDVVRELRALGGTDSSVLADPDLMALVLPAIRADYRALRRYVWEPGPRLRCPVTALVGDSDPVATADLAKGWSEYSVTGAEVAVFRGGHFYVEERLPEVAALVKAGLGLRDRAP